MTSFRGTRHPVPSSSFAVTIPARGGSPNGVRNAAPPQEGPLFLPPRVYWRYTATRYSDNNQAAVAASCKSVGQVHATLQKQHGLRDPDELMVNLGMLQGKFTPDKMFQLRRQGRGGILGPPVYCTQEGWRQIVKEMYGSAHARRELEKKSVDTAGCQVNNTCWQWNRGQHLLAAGQAHQAGQTPAMSRVRTMLTRVDTADRRSPIIRVVRAVRTARYAPFDGVDAMEALVRAGYGDLPVLSVTQTDTQFRARVALKGLEEFDINNPIPIMDVRTSGTGGCSVSLSPGTLKLTCTNGMTRVERKGSKFAFRHVGDTDRMVERFGSIITAIEMISRGYVEAYSSALAIEIDNMHGLLDWRLGSMNDDLIELIYANLSDPTTTPGNNLAAVVDAVTLTAQDETVPEHRRLEMDCLGLDLLHWGIDEARRNSGEGIKVPVMASA